MRTHLLWSGLALLPVTAFGHHSVAGTFNSDTTIEIEGRLATVSWRNPHIRFSVETTDAKGQTTDWTVETTSLSNLRRWDVAPEFMSVGDRIRIAGYPSKRGGNELYAVDVLLPSGKEVLLDPHVKARWSNVSTAGRPTSQSEGDPSHPELGIFRVWSTSDTTPMLFPENVNDKFDFSKYPLTEAARASVASFDQFTQSPILNCAPKGMPTIMEEPYPLEFVRDGDRIRLRLEEYDTVRTIYMNAGDAPAEPDPPRLGLSIGHWENDHTLVVATTRAAWSYFDVVGIPQSAAATMVERFTLSADGSRLDYVLTETDPANFTTPVTLKKHWLYLPGAVVHPYHCTSAP